MKKPKLYYVEMSEKTENGSRNLLRRDLIAMFDHEGNAFLVKKLLEENVYNNMINRNPADNERNIFLTVER